MDYLVESFGEGDHEDLTAPLLVTASVTKEEFTTKKINKYSFQVLFARCYYRN